MPNLFAAMTIERDFAYHYEQPWGDPIVWLVRDGTGVARAAAYGSDSSVQGGVLDPRMNGFAVEPMADVAAAAILSCTENGSPAKCPSAWGVSAQASARVNHRIVPRDPNQVPIGPGDKVPVILDYALHAYSSAPVPLDLFYSRSFAGFSVFLGDQVLYGRKACSVAATFLDCTSLNDESGSWQAALDYSDHSQETIYAIGVRAFASATLHGLTGSPPALADAVADPFLRIDPDWQYASYFMVQQESALHPGEWLEVSRVWTQPVPEPASGALLALGVGVVVGAVHRRKGRVAGRGRPRPGTTEAA